MDSHYDVVIVGAGIAGTLIAKRLGGQGRSVLIIESGPTTKPTVREPYLSTFYTNSVKTPESPYPPANGAPKGETVLSPDELATPRATVADTFAANVDPGFAEGTADTIYDPEASYFVQEGPLPFLSTYERVAGGTTWHWLGTSLRFLKDDFTMYTTYQVMNDWPAGVFDSLVDGGTDAEGNPVAPYYNQAEDEIGVSADKAVQETELEETGLEFAPPGYQYPMTGIPFSLVDEAVNDGVGKKQTSFDGIKVEVTPTPAGRNSQPRGQRRVCAGNTNCIPICPIQAKYDATATLSDALQTGNVTLQARTVASKILVDADGAVSGVEYITYEQPPGAKAKRTGGGTVTGSVVVVAAHAAETPRLLLMSADPDQAGLENGVANSSGLVGARFMDHPLYLSWGLMADPVWGFRGPLTTSGIESLRNGEFRKHRAAWRVEIGNEGWNFSIGDPWTTTLDLIRGTDTSKLNPGEEVLFGDALVAKMNEALPRQWRMGFLVEQTPEATNRITLSKTLTDGLGLPRPVINYDLSEYTRLGFVYAEIFARQVYRDLGARNYTQNPKTQDVLNPDGTVARTVRNPAWFPLPDGAATLFEALPAELKAPEVTNLDPSLNGVPEGFQYFGSGHLVGTYTMGDDKKTSVVDADQRSHDHKNLFLVGSGVFPTITTANPTLTLAALALRAADAIGDQLKTA